MKEKTMKAHERVQESGRSAMISQKLEPEMRPREEARSSTVSMPQLLQRSISEPAPAPLGESFRLLLPSWRKPALVSVKAVHSLIYFFIEFCIGYLIYAGLKGREDRRTAIAAGAVISESLIFVGNRCRCPLTGVTEALGAASGSVTDIYLPDFLASHLVPIHVPLLALALCLHTRNFLQQSRAKLL